MRHRSLSGYLIQVRLSTTNFFGVSAASADSPDSFELFKFAVSSPEHGHPIQNEHGQGQNDGHHDSQTLGKFTDHGKQAQEAIAHGKRGNAQQEEFHGKLPHERDFEEFKEEVPDKPASAYKTQEEQFKDLHDRLTALVCLLFFLYLCSSGGFIPCVYVYI